MELEDTSLKYLDPIGYKEVADEVAARSSAHEEFMAAIQKRIQERMDEEGIQCTVYGRVKHIYSIYRNNTRREVSQTFFFIAKRNILCEVSCLVFDWLLVYLEFNEISLLESLLFVWFKDLLRILTDKVIYLLLFINVVNDTKYFR